MAGSAALVLPFVVSKAARGQQVRPNILFILTDDQPAHTMEFMPRTKVSFSDGLDLTLSAYAAIPLCGPARASLWTGLYPHNHGCVSNKDAHHVYKDRRHPSVDLFSRLSAAGYAMGFFGKIMNGIEDYRWRHGAFDRPEDTWVGMMGGAENPNQFTVNRNGNQIMPGINTTRYFTKQAARFIERKAGGGAPWLAYVALHDPHVALLPEYEHSHDGAKYSSPGTRETDLSDKSAWASTVDDEGAAKRQWRYEGTLEELETVDERVAGIFNVLANTGQLDNTVVIFSSDNGWMYGEHGDMTGKAVPYEEVCRVPFLVRGPGIPTSVEGSPLVGHLDVTATILQAADLPWDHTDGRPLQGLGGPWRRRLLVEHPEKGWAMLREGSYTRFDLPTGEAELYDLSSDPYQLGNLSASPPNDAADLSAKLAALKSSTGDALRAAETA